MSHDLWNKTSTLGLHLLVAPAGKLGKAFYYFQSEMLIHWRKGHLSNGRD